MRSAVKKKLKIYIPMYVRGSTASHMAGCPSSCPAARLSSCPAVCVHLSIAHMRCRSVWKESLNRIEYPAKNRAKNHTFFKNEEVGGEENPLTLIASPQTHKQFIWHTRSHTHMRRVLSASWPQDRSQTLGFSVGYFAYAAENLSR